MQGVLYSKPYLFVPNKHYCTQSLYLVLPCGYTEEVGRKSGQTVAL